MDLFMVSISQGETVSPDPRRIVFVEPTLGSKSFSADHPILP
jgi:hypothetical protein